MSPPTWTPWKLLESSRSNLFRFGTIMKVIFEKFHSNLPTTQDTIGICWRNNTVASELNRVDVLEPALDHNKRRCGWIWEMFQDGFPPCMTQRGFIVIVTEWRGNSKDNLLRHFWSKSRSLYFHVTLHSRLHVTWWTKAVPYRTFKLAKIVVH